MIPAKMLKLVVRGMGIGCFTLLFLSQLFCASFDIEIEDAYREMFAGDIGYTLIGEKPVSTDDIRGYHLATRHQVLEKFVSSLTATFRGSDKFVLKIFTVGRGYGIELIHKKAVRDLISSNNSLRQFINEKFSNEDEFLLKLEDKNTSIFWFNGYIRGLLFGYGEENAAHFCRFIGIADHLKKFPYVQCFDPYPNVRNCLLGPEFPGEIDLPYVVNVPKLNAGFDSLESEWNWLQTVDRGGLETIRECEAVPPYFIRLPIYRSTRSCESDALRAKYVRARAKLAKLFYGKSYQQAVIDEVRGNPKQVEPQAVLSASF